MEVTTDDLQWWLDRHEEMRWTFASTMPDAPHSYVVRGKQMEDADFERAVRVIRTFGEPGKFHDRTNIYLVHNDRKWWTMGAPVEDTIIINTATTEAVYGEQDAPSTFSGVQTLHDKYASEYDSWYLSPTALEENDTIRRIIVKHFGAYAPTMLDVGCGTGLMLDLKITHPALFYGIDPSQGMLNELVRKHTQVTSLWAAPAEQVVEKVGSEHGPFDLVLSTFGSASHLTPETIEYLPSVTTGLLILMTYRDGYLPEYYEETPETYYTSREAARRLLEKYEGYQTRLNDFDVTVVTP